VVTQLIPCRAPRLPPLLERQQKKRGLGPPQITNVHRPRRATGRRIKHHQPAPSKPSDVVVGAITLSGFRRPGGNVQVVAQPASTANRCPRRRQKVGDRLGLVRRVSKCPWGT